MRFEMRLLDTGWCVWDTVQNTPAVVDGRWLTGLEMDDADDLTDRLNMQDERKSRE